ncbi:hypothetical protein Tco_0360497 [Tanacetum coccineum]
MHIQTLVDGKKVILTETSVRRALQLKDDKGEKEKVLLGETQKKQPRRKQRKNTKVPQPTGSTEPITDEAANEEHVPTHSNISLLSGEDRLKLKELLELCTKLSERVLDLENIKTSQAAEITKLKERVKKLERVANKSRNSRGLKGWVLRRMHPNKGMKISNLVADAKKLFDKAMTRVNKFVDTDTKLVKEISKEDRDVQDRKFKKEKGEELESGHL